MNRKLIRFIRAYVKTLALFLGIIAGAMIAAVVLLLLLSCGPAVYHTFGAVVFLIFVGFACRDLS